MENGSFDEWNCCPTGWDIADNVGIETGNVHTLPRAVALGVPPNKDDSARLGQTIKDTDPDCCYVLDFFVTGSSNKPVKAQVLFNQTVEVEVLIPQNTQPQYLYYREFVGCPQGADVSVLFIKEGNGTIFIDDVGLRAAGPCDVDDLKSCP